MTVTLDSIRLGA